MDELFEKYAKELEQITRELPMKKAISAKRTGIINKTIDKIVIARFFWQESFTFLQIIQTLIIFTFAPQAITTINNFFVWLGIPIELPVEISSAFTMLLAVFVLIFGFITVRYMRTVTVGSEYSAKTSPVSYLLWKKLEILEEKIKKLEEKDR